MTSIFSLRCAQCDGELVPAWGAIWTCVECNQTFEVCGRYLVPVIAERDGTEYLRIEHHEAVGTDGRPNTRDGSVVTEQSSSTSPS
jgi:hypothetical protein